MKQPGVKIIYLACLRNALPSPLSPLAYASPASSLKVAKLTDEATKKPTKVFAMILSHTKRYTTS